MGITYDDLDHQSSFAEELDGREIAAVLNTILTEWGSRESLPGGTSPSLSDGICVRDRATPAEGTNRRSSIHADGRRPAFLCSEAADLEIVDVRSA